MATSLTYPQTENINTADALWALIQTQTKSVQRTLAKRFAALDKAERERRKMKAYEATLTPEQKAWATNIVESVKRAKKEVQDADYNGTPLTDVDDFLRELREDESLETAIV